MTRPRSSIPLAGAALLLLVTQIACEGSPKESAPKLEPISVAPPPDAPPVPTPTSTEVPVEPGPVGRVIYEHDFSSSENGLLGGQSSDSGTNDYGSRTATYTADGTLNLHAESELDTYVGGASTLDLFDDLRDVSIEVDATAVRIGSGGNWGLACRRDREVGSFYFAFVGEDGGQPQAGIIRQDQPGGDWTPVATAASLPEGIAIGEGKTNRLRLDCVGSSISLSVDGVQAVEGSDATLGSGAIALFVNPLVISAEVEFDNLVIREAEPATR